MIDLINIRTLIALAKKEKTKSAESPNRRRRRQMMVMELRRRLDASNSWTMRDWIGAEGVVVYVKDENEYGTILFAGIQFDEKILLDVDIKPIGRREARIVTVSPDRVKINVERTFEEHGISL